MSRSSRRNRLLILKFLSLLSVVRGYNILVIVLAQYLAAVFILSPDLQLNEVVFDPNLFFIVLASALAIAGGYIINGFYDREKDWINRPLKTKLDHLVGQNKTLALYFSLNFLAVIVASYVSFRAVLFFSIYIFGIWFYSHKLKRIMFLGNLTSALLALTPFFAVFIYYQNFDTVIFVHAIFLFLILAAREVVKDLENIKGDLALNYKTIPVVVGADKAKYLITAVIALTVIPIYLLVAKYNTGYMEYYFYGSAILLMTFLLILWQSEARREYVLLHNILKLVIVLGVFSILLIDVDLVIKRFVF
ncbi:MAG: geranylgeranylglycerol-phosphate geranylgeranyltransferase [Leeuwenhoekiella sp.]